MLPSSHSPTSNLLDSTSNRHGDSNPSPLAKLETKSPPPSIPDLHSISEKASAFLSSKLKSTTSNNQSAANTSSNTLKQPTLSSYSITSSPLESIKSQSRTSSSSPLDSQIDQTYPFTEIIFINSCRPEIRYLLTQQTTLDAVKQETGTLVISRGRVTMSNSSSDLGMDNSNEEAQYRPLHLYFASESQEQLNKAIAYIRNLMDRPSTTPSGLLMSKIFIDIAPQVDPLFMLNAKIIGPKGSFVKHIQTVTGCKIRLRGRDSNYVETNPRNESLEPLHLFITGSTEEKVIQAKALAESLVKTVKTKYEAWIDERQQQSGGGSTTKIQSKLSLDSSGSPSIGSNQMNFKSNQIYTFNPIGHQNIHSSEMAIATSATINKTALMKPGQLSNQAPALDEMRTLPHFNIQPCSISNSPSSTTSSTSSPTMNTSLNSQGVKEIVQNSTLHPRYPSNSTNSTTMSSNPTSMYYSNPSWIVNPHLITPLQTTQTHAGQSGQTQDNHSGTINTGYNPTPHYPHPSTPYMPYMYLPYYNYYPCPLPSSSSQAESTNQNATSGGYINPIHNAYSPIPSDGNQIAPSLPQLPPPSPPAMKKTSPIAPMELSQNQGSKIHLESLTATKSTLTPQSSSHNSGNHPLVNSFYSTSSPFVPLSPTPPFPDLCSNFRVQPSHSREVDMDIVHHGKITSVGPVVRKPFSEEPEIEDQEAISQQFSTSSNSTSISPRSCSSYRQDELEAIIIPPPKRQTTHPYSASNFPRLLVQQYSQVQEETLATTITTTGENSPTWNPDSGQSTETTVAQKPFWASSASKENVLTPLTTIAQFESNPTPSISNPNLDRNKSNYYDSLHRDILGQLSNRHD